MRLVRLAALFLLLAPIASARAELGQSVLLGDQANLMGGAVAATTRGGASMWYNPAGITLAEHDRASIAVSGAGYTMRWYRAPEILQASGYDEPASGTSDVVVLPRVATFVASVGSKLSLGIGVFNPTRQEVTFQIVQNYPYDMGAGTNALAASVSRASYHSVIALAWTPRPELRFGASVHFTTYSWFDITQFGSVYQDSTGATPDRSVQQNEQIDNFAGGLAASFGVEWQPHPKVRVGASLTSPTIAVLQWVEEVSFNSAADGATGDVTVTTNTVSKSGFTFQVPEPMVLRAGIAYSTPKLVLELDGEFLSPARTATFGVDRRMTGNVRAGALISVFPKVVLGLGLFTDLMNTDRQMTQIGQLDVDGLGGTLGIAFVSRPPGTPRTTEGTSVSYAITAATRYTHYAGQVAGARIGSPGDASSITVGPTSLKENELGLHLGINAFW